MYYRTTFSIIRQCRHIISHYPNIISRNFYISYHKTRQFFISKLSYIVKGKTNRWEKTIMTCSNKIQINTELNNFISNFIEQYGTSGLKYALQLYINTHQQYICRTRSAISKINISDIYYMEIREHQITIHTQHGTYHKYGTLNNELKSLSSYGFKKCAQNRIVSLEKIRSICFNDIILVNGIKIHMSKKYAISIISEFSKIKK